MFKAPLEGIKEIAIEVASLEVDTMAEYLPEHMHYNSFEGIPFDFFGNLSYYQNIDNIKEYVNNTYQHKYYKLLYKNDKVIDFAIIQAPFQTKESVTTSEKIIQSSIQNLSICVKIYFEMSFVETY